MPARKFTNGGIVGNFNANGSITTRSANWEVRDDTLTGGNPRKGYPHFLGVRDIGGAFYKVSNYVVRGSQAVKVRGAGIYRTYKYEGSIFCNQGQLGTPILRKAEDFAAEGYSKMRPDNAIMAGLNAAYELKDVPHMLRQRFLNGNLKDIGDYYLALKFGWEPLLRDVRDFCLSQRKAQKQLKQLLRDEGKPVRRSIRMLNIHNTSNTGLMSDVDGNTTPSFVSQFYRGGKTSTERDDFDEVWASAQFRFWLPGGPRDVNWTRQMLAAIYGFKPTPKVVWNAIPWSWLIDWFSNVGDMIANLESDVADRQAADYGYVMRYSGSRLIRNSIVDMLNDVPDTDWFTLHLTAQAESSTKARAKLGPFHPSLGQNQLSGVQLSILGALGLSKLG